MPEEQSSYRLIFVKLELIVSLMAVPVSMTNF